MRLRLLLLGLGATRKQFGQAVGDLLSGGPDPFGERLEMMRLWYGWTPEQVIDLRYAIIDVSTRSFWSVPDVFDRVQLLAPRKNLDEIMAALESPRVLSATMAAFHLFQ